MSIANALPETARAVVNHRIAVQETIAILKDHYVQILAPLAESWGLEFKAFPKPSNVVTNGQSHLTESSSSSSSGTITVNAYQGFLEPSPVSPSDSEHFKCLSEAISKGLKPGVNTTTPTSTSPSSILTCPALLTGNTDTKFYWDLTRHIYRMTPYRASHDPRGSTIHTVDERMSIEALREMCEFYWAFIREVEDWRF